MGSVNPHKILLFHVKGGNGSIKQIHSNFREKSRAMSILEQQQQHQKGLTQIEMVCGFGVEIDTVTNGFDGAAVAALAERGCNSISLHSNTIQLTSNCKLMFFSLALSGSKTKCSLTCKSHFTRTGGELG